MSVEARRPTMEDTELRHRIAALVDEEHHLERTQSDEGIDEERLRRLHDIEVDLDQCWDLLRQRRARRAAGEDPDGASVRPPSVVEGYRQ
jgi:hypothetical protein